MSVAELFGLSRQPWIGEALCAQVGSYSQPDADDEMFFPGKGGSVVAAKSVCRECPVAAECLQYALDHDERFGIWGGYTERERRRLKRDETFEAWTPKPIEHGHKGYWRGCACDVCLEGFNAHNKAVREARKERQRAAREDRT